MPAQSLLGLTTATGWTVTHKFNTPMASGGNFCVRYKVNSPVHGDAFLKAMDFTAFGSSLEEIYEWTGKYIFEQQILELCAEKNLGRIVKSLDVGKIELAKRSSPLNVAYYVIFEEAKGNVRETYLAKDSDFTSKFKVIHHAAIGVSQLHRNGIAHQDIKPSNILVFSDSQHKVADLGRVVDEAGNSPFAHMAFPGDRGYQPIEIQYGITSLDFPTRKLCDIYMIGSLLYQVLEGVQIKSQVLAEAQKIHPEITRMGFSDALPILISAHNSVLERLRLDCSNILSGIHTDLIVEIIDQMCHPDPSVRGITKRSQTGQFVSIDRFVGKLANLLRVAKTNGNT